MPLVEVIHAEDTSKEEIAKCPVVHTPDRQAGGAGEELARLPGESHPHALSDGSHAGRR